VILPDGTRLTPAGRREHWRRVALIVTRMTGKRVGVDTATRTATGLSSLSRFTCARTGARFNQASSLNGRVSSNPNRSFARISGCLPTKGSKEVSIFFSVRQQTKGFRSFEVSNRYFGGAPAIFL
jgi:hypothetical protein